MYEADYLYRGVRNRVLERNEMATINVRWKCELCANGIIASSRPRLDDVSRYCLPCSASTGKLVKRVAPSLEKKREAKKETVKRKNASKRATVANRRDATKVTRKAISRVQTFGAEGFHIEREAKKIWKLLEPYHNGKRFPKIEMQQRGLRVVDNGVAIKQGKYAGLAYIDKNKIWLRANPEWETLAHELAHLAVGVRQGEHNRRAHDRVFYNCLRDVTQRRFKVRISFSDVTRYGYAVDHIIEKQLNDLNVYEVFKKVEAK